MSRATMPVSWVSRAQCRGAADPEQFTTTPGMSWWRSDGGAKMRQRIGRGAVCDGCPVAALCAADALAYHDTAVIRGGIPLPHPGSATGETRVQFDTALSLVAESVAPAIARAALIRAKTTGAPVSARGISLRGVHE